MRFRSYVDGSERFIGPETSMGVQAALGSDIALVFDECLPFHVTREYTARSTERTHRWLDRCLSWHEQNGPEWQGVYGIVQGGVDEELRRWSAQEVAARDSFGLAIGGTLGQDKEQMYEVVGWTTEELPEARPRHLLGIGDVDDLLRGVELGIDTFDCAMPTRIGRHGMAVVPDPERRWRVDLAKGRYRDADEPLCEGCPCDACAAGYSRAYLHYLFRLRETTGARIVTLHNLAYLQQLMAALRDAIDAGPPGRGRGGITRRRAAVGDHRNLKGGWHLQVSACCPRSGPGSRRRPDRRCPRRARAAARPAARSGSPACRRRRRRRTAARAAAASCSARRAPPGRRARRAGWATGAAAGRRRWAGRGGSAIGSIRRLRGGADRVRSSGVVIEVPSSIRVASVSSSGRVGAVGSGAIPRIESASACSIAAASAKRSSGSRSSARATTSDSAVGIWSSTSCSSGGAVVSCWRARSVSEADSNGSRPASSW